MRTISLAVDGAPLMDIDVQVHEGAERAYNCIVRRPGKPVKVVSFKSKSQVGHRHLLAYVFTELTK